MSLGVIGRKVGMTRVFNEDGQSTPVTVVEVEPNRVTQVKTVEIDGYSALQVTVGRRRASRVTSPLRGHFAKAGTEPGRGCWEFRVHADTASEYETGSTVTVELFEAGQRVDVQGTTIGRGFAGVHAATRFCWRSGHPRQFQSPPKARLYRSESGSRAGLQGKKDGRAYGQCGANATESGDLPSGPRA